ncbi:hypothetical protein HELRODRAFT_162525 [Helobdella robusta]|uniref:Uncharacterized protein n=1 Tax=Helobdella robusta TaxID=6412 RepID=T1ESS9_HELRO|nr:hypothetical protein HELRODRAFT_162525 [Helobdella robusta]ESN99047.1 hypothetical protein HELRODRAFT_162525 [Helobdella robusta]
MNIYLNIMNMWLKEPEYQNHLARNTSFDQNVRLKMKAAVTIQDIRADRWLHQWTLGVNGPLTDLGKKEANSYEVTTICNAVADLDNFDGGGAKILKMSKFLRGEPKFSLDGAEIC